jgi:hypothetical protein
MNDLTDGQKATKPTAHSTSAAIVIAALLFVSTIYVPFTIATIMPTIQTGDPLAHSESFRLSAILVALFLGLGTAISASMTSMPLVLAPAVGLTVFFSQGTKSGLLTVPQLYLSAAMAGLIIFYCNLGGSKSIRYLVLEKMPPQIKSGVAGGIGAILAEKAAEIISEGSGDFGRIIFVLAAIAALTIFACDTYADRLEINQGSGGDLDLRYYLAKLSYVLIPVAVFLLLSVSISRNTEHSSLLQPQPGIIHLFRERYSALFHPQFTGRSVICMIVFSGITAFVILTDIVGTPYQMLDPSRLTSEAAELRESELGQRAIRSSFFADAIMIILNSAVSVPPSVYYAENHVLYNYRFDKYAFFALPGWIYSFAMFVVAGLLIAFDLPLEHFSKLSKLAVSPVLLVIGMQVVAFSIREDSAPDPRPVEGKVQSTSIDQSVKENINSSENFETNHPLSHLPTAIIIILSPVIQLEWSLPLGIAVLVFWNKVHGYPMNNVTRTLGGIATIVVVLMGLVAFLPN